MNPRKNRALQALLTSGTIGEAAKKAGCSDTTLRTYLKDPEFAEEYRNASHAIVEQTTRKLQRLTDAATDRLEKIIVNDGEKTFDHISAVRTAYEYGLRFTEFTDIMKDMEDDPDCTMTD